MDEMVEVSQCLKRRLNNKLILFNALYIREQISYVRIYLYPQ